MIRFLAVLLLLAALVTALASEPPPPVTGAHADLDCDDCHERAGEVVSTKDCVECHSASSNIHPVSMVPQVEVPPHMQLGSGGELLCRSCHQLHGGTPANGFLNAPRGVSDRAAFCAQCHGSQMTRTNPHQARRGTARCAYCHASIPGEGGGTATARADIVKLCDFCHDAVAKDHPRNIDPTLSFPKGLPLATDGSWTCFTCHDPHGTTTTTHYVRAEFAKHFERGREANPHQNTYSACKACHTKGVGDPIGPPHYALRYKGDINVMCVSCHVTDKGHHPTGLPLPEFMMLDVQASEKVLIFDGEGRITCYTCHDNSCSTGEQQMTVRYYDRVNQSLDLCRICHPDLERTNPHVEDNLFCTYCHESLPDPNDPGRGLLTIPKMVCLRCHTVKPHPAGADHLKKPSATIKPDPSLPLGAGGEVSCITCHDPHAQEKSTPKRLRSGTEQLICEMCHWR